MPRDAGSPRTCWFSSAPAPDPAYGALVVGGTEIARACEKHGRGLAGALRVYSAFRHVARIAVERHAAAAAKAAAAPGNGQPRPGGRP